MLFLASATPAETEAQTTGPPPPSSPAPANLTAPPDSAAAADSILTFTSKEALEQPGDTLVQAHGLNAPTFVMLRSIIVPGWGQAKNGAWLKAVLVAGIGAAFYERLYFENRMVGVYQRKEVEAAGNEDQVAFYERKEERHRNHRRDFIWWTALFLGLAGGDAYVDAQLKGFDVKIQVAPEDEPVPQTGGAALGLKFLLSVSR